MMNIPYIGIIRSQYDEPADHVLMREAVSEIEVFEKYADGLFKCEQSLFLEVFFQFHKAGPYQLKTHTYTGNYKGVFATRSPQRPSQIGNTIVRLLERRGNVLRVKGLDAINGTPLIDIKPLHVPMSDEEIEASEFAVRKMNPRKLIVSHINAGKTDRLLLDAGQIHGHFCTGLALGVLMATKAMQRINETSEGFEELLAVVETNSCVADGIQYVTGCTFGNNALIFKDYGKTAFTLARRDGRGIRISLKPGAKDYMHQANPFYAESYRTVIGGHDRSEEELTRFKKLGAEKAFAVLNLDFDKMFAVRETKIEIPPYAPSHESVICDKCGEDVMSTRIVRKGGKNLCIPCAGSKGKVLTGDGIG